MRIIGLDEIRKIISVEIPLTLPTGKIRIKERKSYTDFGIPVATKQKPFSENMYVEWQIGYDVEVKSDKLGLSTFRNKDLKFRGFNGKLKTLYELSEYLYYFYRWNIIRKAEIKELMEFINNVPENNLIENLFRIYKSNPIKRTINGMNFLESEIKYPHIIYDFDNGFFVIAEITIREKQRAVGIQPMLYICFPVNYLRDTEGKTLIGRPAKSKEFGILELNSSHAFIVLESFKIFGMLSKAHKHDVLEILKLLESQL